MQTTLKSLFMFLILLPNLYVVAEDIKILSYNVFLRPGVIGWGDYKQERFAELVEAVRPYDIVGLCEVFDDDLREQWKDRIRTTHPYQIDPPETQNPFLQDGGITFFSRYPVTFSQKTIYQDADDWDACAEKGVIFARLDIGNGRKIAVALTHTQAGEKYFEIRQKQFTQMQNFIEQHWQNGEPLFMIGDFNVVGDKDEQYTDMLRRLNFPLDSYRFLHQDAGYTFNGLENPLAESGGVERLDYIMLHDPLHRVVLQNCLVNKFPMAHPVEKARYMSDHYAIESTVSLGTPALAMLDKSTVALDITLELPRDAKAVQGTLSVQESCGRVQSQKFAIDNATQTLRFQDIASGRVVLRTEVDNRLIHKIFDLDDSRQVTWELPFGQAGCTYSCPLEWQQQPVSLIFSGPFYSSLQLVPGQIFTCTNLPSGQYQIALKIGHRILKHEITLHNGENVDLGTYFVMEDYASVSGLVDLAEQEQVLFVPVGKSHKYFRAFRTQNQYFMSAIPSDNYRVIIMRGKNPVQVIARHFNTGTQKLDFTSRAERDQTQFVISPPEQFNGIIVIEQPGKRVPVQLSRYHLLSSEFTWIPCGNEKVVFTGYPTGQYQFYLYTQREGYWQLLQAF